MSFPFRYYLSCSKQRERGTYRKRHLLRPSAERKLHIFVTFIILHLYIDNTTQLSKIQFLLCQHTITTAICCVMTQYRIGLEIFQFYFPDGDADESSSGGEGGQSSPPQQHSLRRPSIGAVGPMFAAQAATPPTDLAPHLGLPPSVIVTAHPQQPAFRTLAARKAYDEPLDVSIRRKESELRMRPHPYAPHREAAAEATQEAPINLKRVVNSGELTIQVGPAPARAPSPPQSEPVDFSTKKSPPARQSSTSSEEAGPSTSGSGGSGTDTSSSSEPSSVVSYSSSREFKFAKKLKFYVAHILCKNPIKGRIFLAYLTYVWKKTLFARQQQLDLAYGGGANSRAAGNYGASTSGGNVGGGAAGGGGGGGMSGGGAGGGDRNGGGFGGSSSGSGGNNGNNNNNNNRYYGTKSTPFTGMTDEQEDADKQDQDGSGGLHSLANLDIELDFGDLGPDNATSKWYNNHTDINSGKVIENLLNLKTEYPFNMGNTATPVESKVYHQRKIIYSTYLLQKVYYHSEIISFAFLKGSAFKK